MIQVQQGNQVAEVGFELPGLAGCFHIGTRLTPLPLEHYVLSGGRQVALLFYGTYPMLALWLDEETAIWRSIPLPTKAEMKRLGGGLASRRQTV